GSARSSLPGGTGAGSAQRLRELLGQTVDVGLRVHLRHAEKRALAELRILLREVEPAEDAALAQRAIDLGDGAPALVEVGDELLEERRRERRYAPAAIAHRFWVVPVYSRESPRRTYEVRSHTTSPNPYSPSTAVGPSPIRNVGYSETNRSSSGEATKPASPPP